MKFSISRGFTLIELLISIAVIGVLASAVLVIVNPLGQIQKARDAQRKSDLAQIQRALEQYYQDNGRYPAHVVSGTEFRIYMPSGPASGVEWGSNGFSPYMAILPDDVNASKSYAYFSTGQSYLLYTNLDRGANDQQACSGGLACPNVVANGLSNACGGDAAAPCNFGVSSSNITP